MDKAPRTLSLKEIASWSPGICSDASPVIMASVPTLQRGLVWRPQQIELLWDSILRGFPIGVFVICPKIQKQERVRVDRVTHHLLDGQQRANAIALGFTDPFPSGESAGTPPVGSILWLDLAPEFDQSSTRSYLVRVTTTAHPWGYKETDDALPLPIWRIRQSLGEIGLDWADRNYKRPSVTSLWPAASSNSSTPIPIAWPLLAWSDNDDGFWDRLAARAKSSSLPWARKVCLFCANQSPVALKRKARILRGIKRASEIKLILLEAPPELLEISQQEETSEAGTKDVTNIEQIFQRLNGQGTPLDGEELSYSMIKAYWPEMAGPIDRIAEERMPQARMVSIGVRAALAHNMSNKGNLPRHPTVSAIREIATGRDKTKQDIYDFIDKRLENACKLVDKWLKYHPTDNPDGLLSVLVTSIAIDSRDVYLLLLSFAARMIGDDLDEKVLLRWRKPMQALATVLHWFSADKTKAANQVFQLCGAKPTIPAICKALQATTKDGHLYQVHSPADVGRFVKFPSTRLKEWRWLKLIERRGDEKGNAFREKKWKGFLERVFWERELVLYAQRTFLYGRFPNYDPARRDLWAEHDRPWDFDHILASMYVKNRKDRAPFRDVCNEWVYMNGNLRAWPFEDNRSEQAEHADEKIRSTGEREDSLLLPNELLGFSQGNQVRKDRGAAQKFIKTCRQRLLRIYRHWYESMAVAEIQ